MPPDQILGKVIRSTIFRLLPFEAARPVVVMLRRCAANKLNINIFFEIAALAHNLNRAVQASRRSCPLATVQDGFPQQRG
jgi:hypothetical protein